MKRRALPAFLAALFLFVAAVSSQAMDLEVRDIQRALFALGYDVGLPDGVNGAKTRGAIAKFLTDHPDAKDFEATELQGVLDKAVETRRSEIIEKGREVGFYVTPKMDLGNVFTAPERNSIFVGQCGAFGEIDMTTAATIESFSRTCRNLIGYSKSLHALVQLWSDGVTLASPDTISVTQDVMALPRGKDSVLGKGAVFDDGDRAAVTMVDKSVVMLDLRAPYEMKVVGKARYFVQSMVAAENAPVFAVNSSEIKNSRTRVESVIFGGDGKTIYKSKMWVLALSNDGSLAAMAEDDGTKVVIRELASGTTKAEWNAPDVVKSWTTARIFTANTNGRVRFLDDGSLAAVAGDWDEPMRLRFWHDGQKSDVDLPLKGSSDAIQILPEYGSVLTLADGVLVSFDLRTGKEKNRSRSLPFIEPTASAVNGSRDELAVAHDDDQKQQIYFFDLATGGAKSVIDLKAAGNGEVAPSTINGLIYVGDDLAAVHSNGYVSLFGRDGAMKSKLKLATDYLSGISGVAFASSSDGHMLAVGYDASDDHPRIDVISLPSLKLLRSIRYRDDRSPQVLAFVDGDRRIAVDGYVMRVFDVASGKRVLQKDLRAFTNKRTYYKGWINFVLPSQEGSYLIGSGSMGGHAMYKYSNGRIVAQLGRKRPGDSWLPGGSRKAAMLDDGRFVVINPRNSKQLATIRFGAEEMSTFHGQLTNDVLGIHALPGQRFLIVDKGGQVAFFDARVGPDGTSRLRPYATIHAFTSGNWLARTPDGFFAGTDGAASALNIRSERNKLYPVDSVYQVLYRPDLVAEALAGDPDGKHAAAAKEINLENILATGSPPEIAMTIKDAEKGSANGKASVAVELKNAGGGFGRIEWRVNGMTRAVEEIGKKDADLATMALEKSVVLDAEVNQIEVVAYNKANKVASRPATGSIKWTEFARNQKPALYVMSIGVNDYYDSRLHLNYARDDAEAIGKVFSDAGGGLFDFVKTTVLVDGDVTREKLKSAFADLARSIRSYDVFVLFVAGHGITQDGRYYYIPQDFRYQSAASVAAEGIRQEDWQSWLAQLPAKKSLLLFDTCESGTLTGDMAARGGLDRLAAIDRLTHATGRSVLSAATDTGPALEGYRGHGVFAYTLLAAIAMADDNDNGTLEVTEIASYVDANVPKISTDAFGFRQIPQMRLVGANFAVATLSPMALPASVDVPVPTKPTHVAAKTLPLLSEGRPDGEKAGEVPAGTLVTVVSKSSGFARIAREGRVIGFVRLDGLLMIQ